MNKVSAIKKLNDTELELGIAGTRASWHQRYSECDCVYVGGLPDSLTEQDLLGVLEQYGIIIHLNLVRDSHTNASRGFAFAKYADPRSCVLAIDNLNGFEMQGRTLRLDHVDDYHDKDEAGLDTSPPDFHQHREENTTQEGISEHRHASALELIVEKRRENAVLNRLEQLRKKRRQNAAEKRGNESSEEIRPSRDNNIRLAEESDRGNEGRKDTTGKKRKRMEKEKRRREREQRKTERARIRKERAERRAERQNGT